ncbi:MAG TPA: ABC transporter substrate-binding protein, partial [Candidatus Angelobacter sp.]|nr:ABC transporter substrate-binding protein [Candidatus Angelobacter sp.]
TLKPGLMWSGGNGEVTADDVKYSFERILKSDWKDSWSSLDHVDVKDKYSGVIVLNKPFAPVWLLSLTTGVGSIVCKAAVEKLKDQKFTTELPAQCGPYAMTAWVPKQKLTLSRNADWKGPQPEPDEVQIVMIEDSNAAEVAYEANEVDLTQIAISSYNRYKNKMPEKSTLTVLAGPFYQWMGINTENPKLKDIRVRKAIQRAVDVDSILQAAYGGVAPKSYGVVTPGVVGYREAAGYSYNPQEAKALLADAGVSNLELELKIENTQERQTEAQIIQANLADVGIKVKIAPTDSGPFWNLGLESKGDAWKTLEIWLMEFRTQPDPSDAMQWFTKSQVGVWNWERWSDPEFEDLWKKGLEEADATKRGKIYLRMQEIMENTGAYVWITHQPQIYIHRDTIKPAFDSAGYDYFNAFKVA